MVAILPGCLMGSDQLDDIADHDNRPTLIHKLLFNAPAFTSLACAVSHMTAAWDMQHEIWAEVLAEEIGQSQPGTPWAQVVVNAKYRFQSEYPSLWNGGWNKFLAGVSVQGALVGVYRHSGAGVARGSVGEERIDESFRVVPEPPERYRLDYGLGRPGTVDLRIYNVAGQEVAAVLDHIPSARGRASAWWFCKDGRGCRVASGVYFARLSVNGGSVKTKRIVVVR